MLIRKMTINDIEQIHLIEKASFSTPWSKNALMNELNNDRARYYVVIEHEQVMAYGGVWIIFDEGHITNIAVHPQYRCRGLGTQLLEVMIQEATIEGVVCFTLEVRESNKQAISMYKKFGFEIQGTRKGFYEYPKENALIMWLSCQNE